MSALVDAALAMRRAQRAYFDARRDHAPWRDLLERSQVAEDAALALANNLEGDDLASLVTQTVAEQRRYWRREAGADYQLARRLEKQLDAALAAIRQPSLFGGDVLCAHQQRSFRSVVSAPGPSASCRQSVRTALCMGFGAWAAST